MPRASPDMRNTIHSTLGKSKFGVAARAFWDRGAECAVLGPKWKWLKATVWTSQTHPRWLHCTASLTQIQASTSFKMQRCIAQNWGWHAYLFSLWGCSKVIYSWSWSLIEGQPRCAESVCWVRFFPFLKGSLVSKHPPMLECKVNL